MELHLKVTLDDKIANMIHSYIANEMILAKGFGQIIDISGL